MELQPPKCLRGQCFPFFLFEGILQFKFYATKGVFPLLIVYIFLKGGMAASKFKGVFEYVFLKSHRCTSLSLHFLSK